jgi:hypothetical protein
MALFPVLLSAALAMPLPAPASSSCRAVRVDARALPDAFFGAAAAGHQGRVYVFGGHGQGGITNSLWSYDVTRRVVEDVKTTGPALIARRYVSAAVVGDGLFLVGGESRDGHVDVVERVDLKTLAVEVLPPLPTARAFAGVVAFDGKLWVAGGTEGKVRTSRVDVYDPASHTWSAGPSLNHARDGRLVVIDGSLWALPGFDGQRAVPFVEKLAGNRFVDVVGAPATSAFGATVIDGHAVLFGDYDDQATARAFAPASGWSTQTNAFVARRHAAVAVVDDVVVVAGGNRRPAVKSALAVLEAFRFSCEATPLPCEQMRVSDDANILAQHDRLCGVGYGVGARRARLLMAEDPVAAANALAAELTSASPTTDSMQLAFELANASTEARAVLMGLGHTEATALSLPVKAQHPWRARFACATAPTNIRQHLTKSGRDKWTFLCDGTPGELWFDYSTLNPALFSEKAPR